MRTHILLALAVLQCAALAAQTRTVALTVDDLPFVTGNDARPMQTIDAKAAAAANRKLLKAFARHRVPVTGFVIEKSVENLGLDSGSAILRAWVRDGFDLGNHTYQHPDFDDLTAEQFEDQIVRGETTFAPLMRTASRQPEFFRFPFNHTGDTEAKHDAVAAFLLKRGYRQAPCTIETSDWMFSHVYFLMRSRHDHAAAARLRADYLAFTSAQIDYFAALDKQVWGYDAPQIMLIHDNQLNSDVIDDLLAIFEKKGFRWVSLAQAESDPAYQAPDTFITKYGPMWGYRWAKERGVKVDGRLEPEPPQWVTEYGNEKPAANRRPRSGVQ